mmetsp:Transcript_32481/g.76440  ORF Transcript_32481/g.76440 Transcript_32481/m.76440 type:complete len:202 (-) Transcript_32481:286-891(-)
MIEYQEKNMSVPVPVRYATTTIQFNSIQFGSVRLVRSKIIQHRTDHASQTADIFSSFIKRNIARQLETLRFHHSAISSMAFPEAFARSSLPIFRCNSMFDHRVLLRISTRTQPERLVELRNLLVGAVGIGLVADKAVLAERRHSPNFDRSLPARTGVAVGDLPVPHIRRIVVAADGNRLVGILHRNSHHRLLRTDDSGRYQ